VIIWLLENFLRPERLEAVVLKARVASCPEMTAIEALKSDLDTNMWPRVWHDPKSKA
jgi:hypothetical protein